MQGLKLSAVLAARDWFYEYSLSLCAVLALASMLMPLLILQGVKDGIIASLREKLLSDPEVLIITPTGGGPEGSYTEAFIDSLRSIPGVRFAIGRTRDSATDVILRHGEQPELMVQMEPCAKGEPILGHYGLSNPRDGEQPEIVLSFRAAQKLGVKAGDTVETGLGRKTPQGKLEDATLTFRVAGVFPSTAAGGTFGFLPLTVLEDIQDYRDFIAVPRRGFTGNPRQEPARRYESFRLYAGDLDAVEGIAKALGEKHVEVRTKSREIANIRSLNEAISRIILLIACAVGAGFCAFTLSSVQGAVRRKDKMLGMLRLLGFSRRAIFIYPLAQTLLTACFGTLLAGMGYAAVSYAIDTLFAAQSGGASICRLGFINYLMATGIVLLLSLATAARAAVQAASTEPSSVIREM